MFSQRARRRGAIPPAIIGSVLGPLRRMYVAAHESASRLNEANIVSLLRVDHQRGHRPSLLDLGCDTGAWTATIAAAVGASEVHGAEIVPAAAAAARERGITVYQIDLNDPLPLPSASFDIVHSNQVIEHVNDVDLFVSEIYRVLRPGGSAVISTENGSSWHNIFAAIMGWQIFSLTNVSGKAGALGNPFAVHRGEQAFAPTWRHKTILNYRGLKELFLAHGFHDVVVIGAGYYPLFARMGRFDPRHSAFLAVRGVK